MPFVVGKVAQISPARHTAERSRRHLFRTVSFSETQDLVGIRKRAGVSGLGLPDIALL
jgi:hypothetical protein